MRTGRPKVPLVLTEPERHALEGLARRARTAPQVARRARIVLACARGLDNQTVAKKLRVSAQMVGRWRARFVVRRADGLFDEPRPGVPRTITDAQVDAVVTRTLETTPRGATQWSTRTMARASGLSPTTVHRIWRAFGLQPHRTETLTLSPDPLLVDKVRDIVGLYLDPPAHAVVFCVDEKPQIQALDRTAPLLPMQPGQLERRTHTYTRHGTVPLLAALDVQTGRSSGTCADATGPWNSGHSSMPSTRRFPPPWMSTSSWTTTGPTRRRSSVGGSPNGPASMSTSRRRTRRG